MAGRKRRPMNIDIESMRVVVGEKRYRLVPEDDTVDAVAYARTSIARDLRAAREAAGLTQTALAEKLGKSQSMIAKSEAGDVSVGAAYVAAVLKACGLPKNWQPGK